MSYDLRETIDEFLNDLDELKKDLEQSRLENYYWRARYFDAQTLPLSPDRTMRARNIFLLNRDFFVYDVSPEEHLQKAIDVFKYAP